MKREDVSRIFEGATDDQISAILDINSKDIGNAKAKTDSLTAQINTLNDQIKQRESYAASLDSAAEKAKKAKEAQDKLNATLTSYDEIHKLSADDAATAQAGASEIDPDTIFENVPVEGILGDMSDFGKNIVARILAGVVAGDWPAVGDALAFGMNIAVRALTESLPDIRTKAEALAESIAEGINGFMDKFNPYALGNLLAQGINLIFGTAKAFIDTMHWEMLGMTIANSLNGLVRGIRRNEKT